LGSAEPGRLSRVTTDQDRLLELGRHFPSLALLVMFLNLYALLLPCSLPLRLLLSPVLLRNYVFELVGVTKHVFILLLCGILPGRPLKKRALLRCWRACSRVRHLKYMKNSSVVVVAK
jgi:hypothetical protein